MRVSRQLSALALAILTVVAGATGAGAAGAARSATTVSVPTTTASVGAAVQVVVSGIRAAHPVSVRWGDGSHTTLRTRCTAAAAAHRPAACARTATHRYATAGSFSLRAARQGTVIARRVMTIVATSAPAPAPTPSSDSWQQDMLAAVNTLRADNGAGPLAVCAPIQRAAQSYAAAMARDDFFSHSGPDGSDPGSRLAAEGFQGWTWGENIAAGYRSVDAVMAGWIDSPGHFRNLIDPDFTLVGFGRATGGSYGTYWVQDFAAGTC